MNDKAQIADDRAMWWAAKWFIITSLAVFVGAEIVQNAGVPT